MSFNCLQKAIHFMWEISLIGMRQELNRHFYDCRGYEDAH